MPTSIMARRVPRALGVPLTLLVAALATAALGFRPARPYCGVTVIPLSAVRG